MPRSKERIGRCTLERNKGGAMKEIDGSIQGSSGSSSMVGRSKLDGGDPSLAGAPSNNHVQHPCRGLL